MQKKLTAAQHNVLIAVFEKGFIASDNFYSNTIAALVSRGLCFQPSLTGDYVFLTAAGKEAAKVCQKVGTIFSTNLDNWNDDAMTSYCAAFGETSIF